MVRLPFRSVRRRSDEVQRQVARATIGMAVSVCAAAAAALGAEAQPSRIGNYSAGFGEYYVGVLYHEGKYAEATELAGVLARYHETHRPAAGILAMKRAALIAQIHLRQTSPATGGVLLAVRVQALRSWVRGETNPVAFVSRAARVMGWTSIYLAEATPASIVVSGPGGGAVTLPVIRTTAVTNLVSSSEVRPAPPVAVVLQAPQTASNAPAGEKSKSVGLVRPAALGAGAGIKRVRVQGVTPSEATSKQGAPSGRLEDWMEKAFSH